MRKLNLVFAMLLSGLGHTLFASALVEQHNTRPPSVQVPIIPETTSSILGNKRSIEETSPNLLNSSSTGQSTKQPAYEDAPTNISKNFFEQDDSPIPTLEQIPEFVRDMQFQINKCGNAGIEHEARIMRKKGLLEEKDDKGKGPVTLIIPASKEPEIHQYLQNITEEARQSKIDGEEEY